MTTRTMLRVCGRLLRPHGWRAGAAIGASVAGALTFGAVDPLLQKYLVDSLTSGKMSLFLTATVLLAASSLAARCLAYLAALSAQRLRSLLVREQVLRSMATFYRIPYGEVTLHDRGYFVNRVFDEPSRFASGLIDNLLTVVRAAVTLLAAASVALWLSWEVTLGVSLVVPFLLRRAHSSSHHAAQISRREGEDESILKGSLGRAVEAYKTVALFGLDRQVVGTVRRLLGAYQSTVDERVRHGASFQATSGILMSAAELVVTAGAALQVVRGELTVGGLFAFMGAYFRVITAINTLAAQAPAIGKLKGTLSRLREFDSLAVPRSAGPGHHDVHLAGLSLAIGGRPVLSNVHLRLSRGERVLAVGPNGSGKSTLAHVVAGFLDGHTGEHRRPNQNRISALLLPFGFIPGTVRDNVGLDGLADGQRQRFLSLACLFGLQDRLDQDPSTMSQGEQRKLQVAMTLLKPADFYVFDEPLSNVDAASKDVVMRAIFDGTQGSGLVVIMHGDDEFRESFDRELDVSQFGCGGARTLDLPSSALALT